MSICSIHRKPVEGCRACHSMPWDLLGGTKEEYEAGVADAVSEGLLTCPKCGFNQMFKKTCRQPDGRYMCPCCGKYFELTSNGENRKEK